LGPSNKQDYYKQAIGTYKEEKANIKKTAEAFEAESKEWDKKSDEQMHLHHRWAQATTALQIAIALSAIALLTRRKWLQWGVYGLSAFGIALGLLALAHL
jgi:hypothetical protein